MNLPRIIAACLAAALVATLPACAGGDRSPSPPDALDWQDCTAGVQCATMSVPVDWAQPQSQRTLVNLARLPARDPAQRLGTLVVNLGAGASTPILHAQPRPAVLETLTTWFDVVAFDPRGLGVDPRGLDATGADLLVRCAERKPSIDALVLATDEAGWQAHADRNAAYDASCRQAAGPAFAGLTSWQIAHDMDALRIALGEYKLRYFGNSYGAVHGQAYAELFGDRVERIYLDGAPDHTQPVLEDWLRNQALTQERQLERFRDWCAGRVDCPLGATDAVALWDELLVRAQRAPLPAPGAGDGAVVSLHEQHAGMLSGLLTPPRWPVLAAALAKAHDGDATDFRTALSFPPSEPFGTVSHAILCHDVMPTVPSYPEFLDIEARLRQVAPRIGWLEGRFQLARCIGIPGEPAYPPHPLRAPELPPVLLTIGELDSNTANLGAEHLAAQLPGAHVLRHGDGHAAYLFGNTCLAGHVHRYLTDGVAPPPGTSCPGELIAKIPGAP